jgi:import receptor subunit TOM7
MASPSGHSPALTPAPLSERIGRALVWLRTALHVGWLPLVLVVGYLRCEPRPSLFRMLNPLS